MALTTKVLLNKNRQKNDGSYPLIIRVTHNRRSLKIPTGYTLREKDFDARNQQVRSSADVAVQINRLNNLIKSKVKNVYDVFTDLENEGTLNRLSLAEIKDRILETKRGVTKEVTVIQFIDELIDDMRSAKKMGNAYVHKNLKSKLNAYTNNRPLHFGEINYRFLVKLETSHLAGGGDLGGLSVYMRTLRAVFNKAIKFGVTSKENYSFDDYKIKNKKPVRKSLSEESFKKLREYDFEKGSAEYRVKQLFMASFYLRGMNWMDMAYLRVGNLQGDFERLTYVRQKTGEPFNIKISPMLKEIIREFLGSQYSVEDYIFPILKPSKSTNETLIIRNKRQRLNKTLKKISTQLGIDSFTIYAARHTYATVGKRRGVPTAVIQESLGHKTEAITQTYLDSFDNAVVDEYDELIMRE
ncbi:MAG: site-specific integrase [Bacteroidetes bacterium]|nr:site-specific integrase [Bacteroidota bacterium]MDA1120345.1 site-specific integrase [Bacteroidota bacterium]